MHQWESYLIQVRLKSVPNFNHSFRRRHQYSHCNRNFSSLLLAPCSLISDPLTLSLTIFRSSVVHTADVASQKILIISHYNVNILADPKLVTDLMTLSLTICQLKMVHTADVAS